MRGALILLTAMVFLAFWLFDPVALLHLGASCATGHCGVRKRTLALIVALAGLVWLARHGLLRWRRTRARGRAKPQRKARRVSANRVPKSRR